MLRLSPEERQPHNSKEGTVFELLSAADDLRGDVTPNVPARLPLYRVIEMILDFLKIHFPLRPELTDEERSLLAERLLASGHYDPLSQTPRARRRNGRD